MVSRVSVIKDRDIRENIRLSIEKIDEEILPDESINPFRLHHGIEEQYRW